MELKQKVQLAIEIKTRTPEVQILKCVTKNSTIVKQTIWKEALTPALWINPNNLFCRFYVLCFF